MRFVFFLLCMLAGCATERSEVLARRLADAEFRKFSQEKCGKTELIKNGETILVAYYCHDDFEFVTVNLKTKTATIVMKR